MTDVTNVQNAYQMVTWICVRAPLNLTFAIVAYLTNPEMAIPCLCDHLFGSCLKYHHEDCVSALHRCY